MGSNPLINEVLGRMAELDVTQAELAAACNLSQPHISKVLSERVTLAEKTKRKLSFWLETAGGVGEASPNDIVRSLAARLETLRPAKRMQIMELLKAVERLVET